MDKWMNENLLNQEDSATTEKVVSNAQSDVQLLLEQNRKTLELLETQQVQNGLLMQRLCQQETPQIIVNFWIIFSEQGSAVCF